MSAFPRIGLIWHSYVTYGNDVIRGIADYANRYGPWQFFMSQLGDFNIEIRPLPKFDGILLCHDNQLVPRQFEWPSDTPMVSTQRALSGVTDWQVLPDHLAVGRLVAEELIRRGFRNLAYCAQTDLKTADATWDTDRLEGFSQAARSVGVEPVVYRGNVGIYGQHERDEHQKELADWIRSLPKPVGIMAPSDMRARHVMSVAENIGVRVPEEAAVIGVNNEPWTEMIFRGMSSVELDGYGAGYAAAEMLDKLMHKKFVAPGLVRVPPRRLIVRRSSDALATDDADVITAIRFINDHAAKGINVDQVVNAVPVSRRSLERRFQRALGRSILEEIQLVQITRAEFLLADETLGFERVAQMSGFPNAKAFGATLRRVTGSAPTEYRRRLLAARFPRPGSAEHSHAAIARTPPPR